jgi:hypothetical protein
MIMEKSVEWLAGETEVLGENLPQCPHAARTRTRAAAVGSQRLTAELRHGLVNLLNIRLYENPFKSYFCPVW